ncbi:MAG: hypothetical protein Q7W51_11250 [Coriobacteriia bacterium]|nr:hypothetical protein [Coriobacteriia bacterium]
MMYGNGYGNMMGGNGWFGGLLAIFFGILVLVGVVLLVIWLVKTMSGHSGTATGPQPGAPGHDEAVTLARKRFASGELTREQFDEIMQALGS